MLIFLGVIMFIATVTKFFSKNIEKDEWKDVKNSLMKTQFADVIGEARIGFIISVIYLLIVIYFPNFWISKALGNQNLLMSLLIVQLFFAAMWLSPQQSKFAVIIFFYNIYRSMFCWRWSRSCTSCFRTTRYSCKR